MRFWDSSALVALHVEQSATRAVRGLFDSDPVVLAWVLSDVEIRSALCRMLRDGLLAREAFQELGADFERLFQSVHLITLIDAVRVRAKRLLGVHPLRSADSLQLAAALTAVQDEPLGWEFACLDERLAQAARTEGFRVVP